MRIGLFRRSQNAFLWRMPIQVSQRLSYLRDQSARHFAHANGNRSRTSCIAYMQNAVARSSLYEVTPFSPAYATQQRTWLIARCLCCMRLSTTMQWKAERLIWLRQRKWASSLSRIILCRNLVYAALNVIPCFGISNLRVLQVCNHCCMVYFESTHYIIILLSVHNLLLVPLQSWKRNLAWLWSYTFTFRH